MKNKMLEGIDEISLKENDKMCSLKKPSTP